jgi:hypothetical protein
MSTRTLKIEEPGISTPSIIRLKGKWLERAGFPPREEG